ncbi:hypothetical protein FRC14_006294, partial [Serendipita sp. 396]
MFSKLLRLLVIGLSVQSSLGAVVADAAAVAPTLINPTVIETPITRKVVTTTTTTTSSTVRPTSVVVYSTSTTKPSSSSSTIKPSSSSTIKPSSSTIKPTSTFTSIIPQPTFNQSDPILDGNRTQDIFADIKGIYGLPGQQEVIRNATLNATNIQGDI